MKTKLLLTLLFMLSFSYAESLSCSLNAIEAFQSGDIASYGLIAVIMLNVVLIALAYMAGEAFHLPEAAMFAKDEKFHLFFSIILLLCFNAILFFSCSVAQGFVDFSIGAAQTANLNVASLGGANMADAAANALLSIQQQGYAMLNYVEKKSIDYKIDSAWLFSNTLPLQGTVATGTDAYRRIYANQLDSIIGTFLLPSITMIELQRLFLIFINQYTIPLLLPLAFLFRIFIPTRHMGNLLLALSVGLAVVLPMFYLVNLSMIANVHSAAACTAPSLAAGVPTVAQVIGDTVNGPCTSVSSFWNLGKLIAQAFFLPNLTLAIFVTFLSSANKALSVIG
ncbi:MAG: hypothetical protein ABII22_03210 [Candidatus Micrarchaeota archaeon]